MMSILRRRHDRPWTVLVSEVVGIHVLGPNAGEIIQGLAVAIRCGVTKEHFDDCVS
jgi:pyruvate/2-oxoglutarate dehydrogenase complex dihydrolipoamide dehydrogenase (E3) component